MSDLTNLNSVHTGIQAPPQWSPGLSLTADPLQMSGGRQLSSGLLMPG